MRGLLLALLLVFAVPASAGFGTTNTFDDLKKYEMWIQACFYGPYSCEGLSPPDVLYRNLPPGLYGRYWGGDFVEVSSRLSGDQQRATLHHEFMHYIQVKVGKTKVPGPAEQICKAEEEAFKTTDDWWDRIGRSDKKRGEDWWKPYSHCRKYYDPSWTAPVGVGW